jgi:hypothetical protein
MIYAMILIDDAVEWTRSDYPTWVALGVAGTYLLLKDCLFRGASLGKFIFRLVVVDARSGLACGIFASCRRNGVLIVAVAGACLLTWVLSLLVGPKVAGKAGAAVILLLPFIHLRALAHGTDPQPATNLLALTFSPQALITMHF